MVYRFYKKVYIAINNPNGGGADVSSFSTTENINECLANFQWPCISPEQHKNEYYF
jgi:hypothetical protein